MDVTRQNFKETLPVVSKAINDACFLAIDAEFTGLTTRRTENAQDTCPERYRKQVRNVKDFMIVQFGLCAFSWDEEGGNYVAKPFNFYLFPKPFNRQMPDIRFLCQSSSMDFLANQGFDFNKWIYNGIPFLLPNSKEKLTRMLDSYRREDDKKSTTSTPEQKVAVPPEYEKTIEEIMKKVDEFVENAAENSLSLPRSSPFVRRLVYSSVKTKYTSGLHLESKADEENQKYILVTKVTDDEKTSLQNEKREQDCQDIEMAEGFSKVIRLISLSGRPVVAHNMMLDIMHLVRLFVSPLPVNLDGFKALVRSSLPNLVDTKLMASTAPLQEHFSPTHLAEVFKRIEAEPFQKPSIVLPDNFDSYSEDSKAHEAGYDAYMTGVAFVTMATHLEKLRDGSTPETQFDIDVVKPFMNKVFLYPRIEDIPYLNLDGQDIIPVKDHVFYLQFPSSWQRADVQGLFKPFGFVYVTMLDNTSAFVSVAKKDRATKVLVKLDIDDVPYRIMSYKEYCEDALDVEYYDEKDGERSTLSMDVSCDAALGNQITPMKPEAVSVPDKQVPKKVRSSDSEVEEGELPDSPTQEPPTKKVKGQHTYFDEPADW